MKTNKKYVVLVALPLILTGCGKGLESEGNRTGNDGSSVGNGIEVLTGNAIKGVAGGTKTHLTSNDLIAWSDGDQVFLLGATNATLGVEVLGNDATRGFLSGSIPQPFNGSVAYTALYPAAMFSSSVTSATNINGTLPTSYNYTDYATTPLKCYPMYAQSSNKVLDFQGVCGMLEINLKGEMSVTSVKVSTTSADKHLAGEFSIDASTGEATLNGDEDAVEINCSAGVKLNATTATSFYIPLIPGDYEKITVKVCTKEMTEKGGSCEYTMADFKVEKGMIYASGFTADRDVVQLWPGGPWWATSNLGATAPYEYGDYYMWGQVTPSYSTKTVSDPDADGICTVTLSDFATGYEAGFNWEGYFTLNPWDGLTAYPGTGPGASAMFKKYPRPGFNLSDADDAAYLNWGSDWRLPTLDETVTMAERCYSEYTSNYVGGNGKSYAGLIVYAVKNDAHRGLYKNKNGKYRDMFGGTVDLPEPSPAPSYDYTVDKHIFLPRNGHISNTVQSQLYGFYWASTVARRTCDWFVGSWYFHDVDVCNFYYPNNRYYGFGIRPVRRTE